MAYLYIFLVYVGLVVTVGLLAIVLELLPGELHQYRHIVLAGLGLVCWFAARSIIRRIDRGDKDHSP